MFSAGSVPGTWQDLRTPPPSETSEAGELPRLPGESPELAGETPPTALALSSAFESFESIAVML